MNDRSPRSWRAATLCVHGGHRANASDPSVTLPTVRSSTFLQHEGTHAAVREGRVEDVWIYARYANPTVAAVERRLAALEGAERSLLFSSGTAGLHAAIRATAPPGSTLLASDKLYGGTIDLLQNGGLGLAIRFVDVTDADAVAAALGSAPESAPVRLVLFETVSNPTLAVADLPEVAARVHAAGARVLVDATFTSPLGQRSLALGADLVMHSASKYLSGHSDVIAGAVSGSAEWVDPIWHWRKRLGGCLDPEPASLLDRGLKTLALRLGAQTDGALRLASFLDEHAAVARVHYPGLASHPQRAVAERVLELAGGMLSFELSGGDAAAMALLDRLRLVLDAPSLGGVETLASLPAVMSHPNLTPEEREAAGIQPGLVRISVGIEDPEDLVADFAQALEGLG